MDGHDSVTITGFQPGERVGFFLVADGRCLNQGTFYTIDSLNPDGLRHMAVFKGNSFFQIRIKEGNHFFLFRPSLWKLRHRN
jgi:hypothetical protein